MLKYRRQVEKEEMVKFNCFMGKFRLTYDLPGWYWFRRNNICESDNCYRYLDLSCRTCYSQGKRIMHMIQNPYLFVIWCLHKQLGLPRALVRHICEHHLTLLCKFEFHCPYTLVDDDTVNHTHCMKEEGRWSGAMVLKFCEGEVCFNKWVAIGTGIAL